MKGGGVPPRANVEMSGTAECRCKCEFTATKRVAFARVCTPAIAEHILSAHNVVNRRISKAVAERYARDMRNGRWLDSNDDISFAADGRLLNGQHRLRGVVLSGASVELWFKLGLSVGSQLAMDDHARRSLDGQIKLCLGDDTSPRTAGIVRAMFNGPVGLSKLSNAEAVQFYEKHREAIRFASDLFATHRPRLCVAHVMAVVARAWYSADRNRLAEFAVVLLSGLQLNAPPDDQAAVALRNLLLMDGGAGGGITARQLIYRKTQRALVAFLGRKPLSVLRVLEDDAFPLPEDKR